MKHPYAEKSNETGSTEALNRTLQLQHTNLLVPETCSMQVNEGPELSSNTERPAGKYSSLLSSRDNLVVGHKRFPGGKAAKKDKRARLEVESEDHALQYALDSCTKGFSDASAAPIVATNDRAKEPASLVQLIFEIEKDATNIEALKDLFNDNDVDSQK